MSHYGTVTTSLDQECNPGTQRMAALFMLEALTDRFGLAEVLDILAEVQSGKSEHLASNWGDMSASETADKHACLLALLADSVR